MAAIKYAQTLVHTEQFYEVSVCWCIEYGKRKQNEQKKIRTKCLHTIDKKLHMHTHNQVCMLNFLHSHANRPINTFIQLDKMEAELDIWIACISTAQRIAWYHAERKRWWSHASERTRTHRRQIVIKKFLYNYSKFAGESSDAFQPLDGKWSFELKMTFLFL